MDNTLSNICVFCGSSKGHGRTYANAAKALAQAIAHHHLDLIYGGADVGLMKILADAVIKNERCEVIGIMPTHLIEQEVAHTSIHHMIEVSSMAERKTLMLEMGDAFVALPGGFGTLDEISEVLVMNQLQQIHKPIALLNTKGYYNAFIRFCKRGVKDGFIRQEHLDNLIVADDVAALMAQLKQPLKAHDMTTWIHDIKEECK